MIRLRFAAVSLLLYCVAAAAQLQIVTPFTGSSCGGSTFANAISANGVLTCATPSAGSVVLNNIGAATGSNTIANGNNTGQVWNWANTSDGTTAFAIGETTAATNGTSTGGVPNQVLLNLSTLSSSTQSPLSVFSRGNHVFSVSPTARQLLATNGTVSAPSIAFASSPTTGIYNQGSPDISFTVGGGLVAFANANFFAVNAGTSTAPGLTDATSASMGLFWLNTGRVMGVGETTVGEVVRFSATSSAPLMQASRGSSDSTAFAVNSRKARGTVASPSVITSGDELLTIGGYGYVGGTNTYRNAATITFASTGTISDATNGIGGNLKLLTQKQGTDTSPQERLRVDQLGHVVSIAGIANTPTMGACGTSPTVTGTDNVMVVTVGTGGAATSCAISFGSTWATNAPVCVAQNDTDIVAYKIAATTTGITITATAAFSASSKLNVLCMGQQ